MKKVTTLQKLLFLILLLAALRLGSDVDSRDAAAASLQRCVATTDATDAECDSCYHAIYGATDTNCGLCYEY